MYKLLYTLGSQDGVFPTQQNVVGKYNYVPRSFCKYFSDLVCWRIFKTNVSFLWTHIRRGNLMWGLCIGLKVKRLIFFYTCLEGTLLCPGFAKVKNTKSWNSIVVFEFLNWYFCKLTFLWYKINIFWLCCGILIW